MTNEDIIKKYIKKETPQKIIYRKIIYPSHKWVLNEEGEPDYFAWESGYHNGYLCERCGYSFCHHCDPNGFDKEPCIEEEDICSSCGASLLLAPNKIFYCSNYG